MGESARAADATIVISPHQHDEAVRLLGLDPATVHWLPDGVDVERFAVRRAGDAERRARWLEWLVRDPQGWDEATRRARAASATPRTRCSTRSSTRAPASRGRC